VADSLSSPAAQKNTAQEIRTSEGGFLSLKAGQTCGERSKKIAPSNTYKDRKLTTWILANFD
jgi:hypothetical protein